MKACKLEAHPDKTKIVYGRDSNRTEEHPHTSFDFLGYTFRPRTAINQRRKEFFVSFAPAVRGRAARHIVATVRQWKLHEKSAKSREDLSRIYNRVILGRVNYYGSTTSRHPTPSSSARIDGLCEGPGRSTSGTGTNAERDAGCDGLLVSSPRGLPTGSLGLSRE